MHEGFKYIGKLPSIKNQRLIVKSIIKEWIEKNSNIDISLIVLGIGDGKELSFILEDQLISSSLKKLLA